MSHFLLIFLFVVSTSAFYGMEPTLGKRKFGELEHVAAQGLNQLLNINEPPHLVGTPINTLPDDVLGIILNMALEPNRGLGQQPVEHVVKTNHPCLRVSKKFKRVGQQVLEQFYARLSYKYPKSMARIVEASLQSATKVAFLTRIINSKSYKIFDLKHGVTPLMIAAVHNNEPAVDLLLQEASKKGIVKEYVNLSCGSDPRLKQIHKNKFSLANMTNKDHTALDFALAEEVSPSIVKKLLEAGANPNPVGERLTPLERLLCRTCLENIPKVSLLCEFGADPNVESPALCSAYREIEIKVTDVAAMRKRPEMTNHFYVEIWKIFNREKKS